MNKFMNMLGFGRDNSEAGQPGIKKGFPVNAAELIAAKSVVVVDVRETSELAEGKAKDSIHMPLSAIQNNSPQFEKFLDELPKDKEIWIYCRAGSRAQTVGALVNAKGYRVRNIGGFVDWKLQGLPI